MSKTVDARGLSCPQPVLMTLEQIKQQAGNKITVLVDSETSRENVSRAANAQGWSEKDVRSKDGEIRITITREL